MRKVAECLAVSRSSSAEEGCSVWQCLEALLLRKVAQCLAVTGSSSAEEGCTVSGSDWKLFS